MKDLFYRIIEFLFSFCNGLFLISFVIFLIQAKSFEIIDAVPFAIFLFLCFFNFAPNKNWVLILKENTPKILSPIIFGLFLVFFKTGPLQLCRELFVWLGVFFIIITIYEILILKKKPNKKNPKNVFLFLLTFFVIVLISSKLMESLSYQFIPFIFAGFYLSYAFSHSLYLIFEKFKTKITFILLLSYVIPLIIVFSVDGLAYFFISFIILGLSDFIRGVFFQ